MRLFKTTNPDATTCVIRKPRKIGGCHCTKRMACGYITVLALCCLMLGITDTITVRRTRSSSPPPPAAITGRPPSAPEHLPHTMRRFHSGGREALQLVDGNFAAPEANVGSCRAQNIAP